MNKDRVVGVAIFGGAALVLFVFTGVKALTVPGFRLWDALGGFSLGIAVACLLFGLTWVRRVSGFDYLLARLRSR